MSPAALDLFLKGGDADTVLVAPKRAQNFKRLLEGLRQLQETRVADR
jgi:hypothetical protein